MTYAHDRRVIDADSHLMSAGISLTTHRSRFVPRCRKSAAALVALRSRAIADRRGYAALIALGDDLVRKGSSTRRWRDRSGERSAALDLLIRTASGVLVIVCAIVRH